MPAAAALIIGNIVAVTHWATARPPQPDRIGLRVLNNPNITFNDEAHSINVTATIKNEDTLKFMVTTTQGMVMLRGEKDTPTKAVGNESRIEIIPQGEIPTSLTFTYTTEEYAQLIAAANVRFNLIVRYSSGDLQCDLIFLSQIIKATRRISLSQHTSGCNVPAVKR